MGSYFAFDIFAVNSLKHAARNLAGAKAFNCHALAKVFIRVGKLFGDPIRRQFDADLALDRTQFIDIDFHLFFLRHRRLRFDTIRVRTIRNPAMRVGR